MPLDGHKKEKMKYKKSKTYGMLVRKRTFDILLKEAVTTVVTAAKISIKSIQTLLCTF
jgi:hypothetical protein